MNSKALVSDETPDIYTGEWIEKKQIGGKWPLQSLLILLFSISSTFVTVTVQSINFIRMKEAILILKKTFFTFELSYWLSLWTSITNCNSLNIYSLRKTNVSDEYFNIWYKNKNIQRLILVCLVYQRIQN